MKAYYIIPLNYWLTVHHLKNFKIKLYYFQERLILQYNMILKLLFLFHIYVSSEITNLEKDVFYKEHS